MRYRLLALGSTLDTLLSYCPSHQIGGLLFVTYILTHIFTNALTAGEDDDEEGDDSTFLSFGLQYVGIVRTNNILAGKRPQSEALALIVIGI